MNPGSVVGTIGGGGYGQMTIVPGYQAPTGGTPSAEGFIGGSAPGLIATEITINGGDSTIFTYPPFTVNSSEGSNYAIHNSLTRQCGSYEDPSRDGCVDI